jgi:nucleoid DNA-binding protein
MIPKKPKLLYKQLAEETNLNETLIDNLITFYYKEVRSEMSALNHTKIYIDGLGQFIVKSKTVDNLILKYERIIAKADNYSFSSYHNKIRLTTRLEELNAIKLKLQEDKSKKQNFLIEKNGRKTNNNLEE